MYIKVRLFNGFQESLWYEQPAEWPSGSLVGAIVRVPLRNQQVPALVIEEQQRKPNVLFTIRPATALEPVPDDPHYYPFIRQLSSYYQISPLALIKRMKQFLFQKEMKPIFELSHKNSTPRPVTLTSAQQSVVAAIRPALSNPFFMPSLLHGVTGSGKTEVYKELITTALAQEKTTVLCFPKSPLPLNLPRDLRKNYLTFPFLVFILQHHQTKNGSYGINYLHRNRFLYWSASAYFVAHTQLGINYN